MRKFSEIVEARGDTAVFTFGRFNPPTTGHEKLLDAVAAQVKKNPGAPYYVFASHSENAKKDPLPYAKKVAYMKKMFPKHSKSIFVDKSRQVFEIAVTLYNKGHKSIVMVVGSDRVSEFDTLLNKYNGVEGRHGYYGFDNIEVVSAGERDPDAEGVSGMSASKMRAAASENRYENEYDERGKIKKEGFEAGLPKGFSDGKKLFADVRKHMGIRESFVPVTNVMTDEDVIRDLYIEGKLYAIGDIVEDTYSGVSGEIIRRGTNYVTFVEEDGTTHKKWLHDISERDYKKEYANYQGTPEQIARRSSRNKARRAMGDKAVKGMDVGHKDNNPMNNDPSNLRNEDPSDNRREPRLREAPTKIKTSKTFPNLKYSTKPSKRISLKDLDAIDKDSKNKSSIRNDRDLEEVKQDKDIKDRKGTEPAKYYAKDADGDEMSKSTKQKRAAHFAKGKDGPAPGDATAKTKPSKSTKKFKDMFGEDEDPCWDTHKQVGMKKKNGKMVPNCVAKEEFQLDEKIEGLITKADKSGVSYGILKKVYDRGMAAWKTGHRPGTTPQQWAFARVNSFLTGGKTRTTADADLWKQAKGQKEDKEDPREIGTDAQRKERQRMTPKQPVFSFKEHISCGTIDCCSECETSSLIESNQYRVGSEAYYKFFQEKRKLYESGKLNPVGFDKELLDGNIGEYAMYNGNPVALDCPMQSFEEEKDVELNKPKVGGSKKYYVYVKDPSTGNVKKISWGDTTGLKVKLDDPEARKSFAARHDCENKKDRTTAGYWACNLPRYAKQLGLSGGGNFFW